MNTTTWRKTWLCKDTQYGTFRIFVEEIPRPLMKMAVYWKVFNSRGSCVNVMTMRQTLNLSLQRISYGITTPIQYSLRALTGFRQGNHRRFKGYEGIPSEITTPVPLSGPFADTVSIHEGLCTTS